MKYFKYPLYDNILRREYKLRFKNLDKKAQRNARINDAVSLAFVVLFFVLLTSLILLTKYLARIIENKVLNGLMIAGMIIVIPTFTVAITIFTGNLIDKHLSPLTIGELTLQNIQRL